MNAMHQNFALLAALRETKGVWQRVDRMFHAKTPSTQRMNLFTSRRGEARLVVVKNLIEEAIIVTQ